jgi:hypothetical protein
MMIKDPWGELCIRRLFHICRKLYLVDVLVGRYRYDDLISTAAHEWPTWSHNERT